MTDLSTCAFKMESGALRGADATELGALRAHAHTVAHTSSCVGSARCAQPAAFSPSPRRSTELLQLIGIVLDSIATMRGEAVDGYFDALVTTLRQSTWGSVSSVRSTGEDDAAGVSGGGGEGAKDDHFVSSGRHRRQSAVGESHPSGRRQRRQSASGVPGSGGGAFAVRRAGAVGASAPVYNSSESLFSSETAGAATPGAGGSVRRSSLSLNYDGSDGGDAAASGGSGGQRGQLPFGGMRRNLSCSSALAATVLPQLMTRTLSAAAAGAVTEPALSTPKSPIACATPPRASYDVASSSNHYQQRKVVGVLGSDDVARAVTAAVVAKSTGADVLLFDSPADLLLGMGVRLDGGGIDCESASVDVVFVCSGPGLRLGGRLADLPLVTVDGVRRRFLFVGEMEEDLETEALMSDVCDVVRFFFRFFFFQQPLPATALIVVFGRLVWCCTDADGDER